MRHATLPSLVAAIAIACLPVSHAHGDEPMEDGILRAASSGDPLELGRWAWQHGDGAVIARLDRDGPTDAKLAAIHAAPFLRAPEQALGPLVRIAAGRDPDLAPEAAVAAHRITTELTPFDLDRREVSWGDLEGAWKRLRRLAADRSARPDIRKAAAFAADALSHSRGPAADEPTRP